MLAANPYGNNIASYVETSSSPGNFPGTGGVYGSQAVNVTTPAAGVLPVANNASVELDACKLVYAEALDAGNIDEIDRLHRQMMQIRAGKLGLSHTTGGSIATTWVGTMPAIHGGNALSYVEPSQSWGAGAIDGFKAINGGIGTSNSSLAIPPSRIDLPPHAATMPLTDRDACRLFIGCLPLQCTDQELKALVDQVPYKLTTMGTTLLECRVLPGKGCGYIKLGSWEAAVEALQTLDNRRVDGWSQTLRLKWALPKDQREAVASGHKALAPDGGLVLPVPT
eukprot:gnl/MRDRNA2_/MRDRNA2_75873_c0_seq1.p1 gnl/MRDRNA2_/MRDRNA2_75873_c0~~gnl/MRDRNA2_/MRDRNA2_75873_c0_seq1.p1  ORF type:complete len:281 (+),score=47.00 gnl/MRDRNA2_/MRDRNA2_75873_c0_seq1:73-915(+)